MMPQIVHSRDSNTIDATRVPRTHFDFLRTASVQMSYIRGNGAAPRFREAATRRVFVRGTEETEESRLGEFPHADLGPCVLPRGAGVREAVPRHQIHRPLHPTCRELRR